MRHVRAELQQSVSAMKEHFEADGLVSMHRHINARVRDEVQRTMPSCAETAAAIAVANSQRDSLSRSIDHSRSLQDFPKRDSISGLLSPP